MIYACRKCTDFDDPCLVIDLDKDHSIPINCPFSKTLLPEFKETKEYELIKGEKT